VYQLLFRFLQFYNTLIQYTTITELMYTYYISHIKKRKKKSIINIIKIFNNILTLKISYY